MRRKLFRFGLIAGAILFVAGGALGGLYFAFMQNFKYGPPTANYPRPGSALEAQRQDLNYFARAIALDRSFPHSARVEAARRIAALERIANVLPQQKFHVALMQITALADNGHTRMRVSVDGKKLLLLPVRIARFAEGYFVMRANTAYGDMLGGRVESIDGVPFPEILKRLETLRGGTEPFRRESAAMYIIVQDLLYGLDIAHSPEKSRWTVRLPDGRLVSDMLVATPQSADNLIPDGPRWRSPEPIRSMGNGWLAESPTKTALPLSERNLDALFVRARVPGSCATYVRLSAIESRPGWRLQPFLSETEADLSSHPACAVILDLRGNGGGDYTNMWHFTHVLPKLIAPHGHIYLLTDPSTFSAAITTTAFTKQAGGGRVTIIGEPVGDRLSFYSEGGDATLPNSKLGVGYQTGRHDYAHPCSDWHECYWINWIFPVRVKTLAPDIPVPSRFSDWYAGHDPAFEDAVALASGAAQRAVIPGERGNPARGKGT